MIVHSFPIWLLIATLCSTAHGFSHLKLPTVSTMSSRVILHSNNVRTSCPRGAKSGVATFRQKFARARSNIRSTGVQGLNAMFTGIVEEMGTVSRYVVDKENPGVTISVRCSVVTHGAYEGCSIAVNGVCLTVIDFNEQEFSVGVSPETLRLTNLGDLNEGSLVNLERAASIDGRNSGHMVQGHVDNVGEIIETWPDKESMFFKIRAPANLMKYIVPKGFIAVDGTSLTVCETNVEESWFTLMLIDYTQKHVILPKKSLGGKVNLEVDVISKYVERSITAVTERLDNLEKRFECEEGQEQDRSHSKI